MPGPPCRVGPPGPQPGASGPGAAERSGAALIITTAQFGNAVRLPSMRTNGSLVYSDQRRRCGACRVGRSNRMSARLLHSRARYGDRACQLRQQRQDTRPRPAAALPSGLAWEALLPIRSPSGLDMTCFAW